MVLSCVVCGNSNLQYSFHRFPKNERKRREWLSACGIQETYYRSWWRICSKHFREIDFDSSLFPKRVLLSTAVPAPSKKNVLMKKNMTSPETEPSASTSAHVPEASEKMKIPKENVQHVQASQTSPTISEVDTSSTVFPPIHEVKKSTPDIKLPEIETPLEMLEVEPSLSTVKTHRENVRYVGDLDIYHFSTPRKAKRHLEFVKHAMEEQKKKIRKLWDQTKTLEHRMESIENLLDHLMEKNILSEHAAHSILVGRVKAIKDFQFKNS